MLTSLIIAFFFGWKLAFVVVAFLPILILGGVVESQFGKSFSRTDGEAMQEGGKVDEYSNILNFGKVLRSNIYAHGFYP